LDDREHVVGHALDVERGVQLIERPLRHCVELRDRVEQVLEGRREVSDGLALLGRADLVNVQPRGDSGTVSGVVVVVVPVRSGTIPTYNVRS
jgi:hypothetical protein